MIRYSVFNPLTGINKDVESLEEAKALKEQYIKEYFLKNNMFYQYFDDTYFKDSKPYADEFSNIYLGFPETTYAYSVYNTTTDKLLSQVFIAGPFGEHYLIKVADGEVTEYYKYGLEYKGKIYEFALLDFDTEKPLELYSYNHDTHSTDKYDLEGNFIVKTQMGSYYTMSEEEKQKVKDFPYKDTIERWSDKEYGFIVEYGGPVHIKYENCNDQQKEFLDNQKKDFINKNPGLFTSNKIVIDENGNSTWTALDL